MNSRQQQLPMSIKELEQLSRLANQTYISGWVVDLHEYLGDVTQSAMDRRRDEDQALKNRASVNYDEALTHLAE
jgi:hypothetical protein